MALAIGPFSQLASQMFAARLSGLAFGLALAVRPAGSAVVSRVNGAPKACPRGARMLSTVEAGGADPDNARHSVPVTMSISATA